MNLIDTHAHLTWDSFKPDLDSVIQRALDVGVKTVINIGADLESSKKAVKLDCGSLKCFSSIGLHPHESSNLVNDVSIHQGIKKLEQIYRTHSKRAVAVGECGLDYHFGGPDFTFTTLSQDQMKVLQKKLFIAQINLAKKLNLPLIIHCRDAWENIFLPELKNTQGVFHSFTGSKDQAQKVLNLGYYLGFTCIITYPKNESLRQIIKEIPLERILTETDCPFLPPQKIRGQRNEPANVTAVVKTISEIKNLSFEEVAKITYQNASYLFFQEANSSLLRYNDK